MSNAAGVIATAVTIHVPRMAIEDKAPEFQRDIIAGSKAMGETIRALKLDAIVIVSAHWVSTFNWYATSHAVHEGRCVADEAPDLVPGLPYRHPGSPALANAIADTVRSAGIPMLTTDCPDLGWDYATYVPLHYLDPAATLPVIRLPVVICCDLDEAMKVGAAIHEAARREGKRIVLIASSALSHAVERGPEKWPTAERQSMDRQFIQLALDGRSRELIDGFPEWVRPAAAEMGGKPVATMFGALASLLDRGDKLDVRQFGPYTQSSASGNVNLLWAAEASR
jgi:3,4-dihydroxyphenylacetate 2,3-dioxygenase